MEKKPVLKVSMKFVTKKLEKSIDVQILQSDETNSESYISVSGDDATWVNGVVSKLNEIISLCEVQPQHRNFSTIYALTFTTVALICYFKFIVHPIGKIYPNTEWIFALLGIATWLYLFVQLNNLIIQLWPAIEFETGPAHLRESRRKRKVLIFIITIIIIPLVLAAGYDLGKAWISK